MIGNIGNLENIIYSDLILSAVYSADRLFYAIFDGHHRLVNGSLSPIKKADLSDLISRGFKKKIVAVDGASIHLPKGIQGASLLNDSTFSLPHSQAHSDNILGVSAYTHYLIDRKSDDMLKGLFEESEIMHQSTVIAAYLYPATKDKVLLMGREDCIYIGVMGQEGLKMVNRYTISQPEDYLYYLNLCFSRLGLDHESTSIEIAGRIDSGSKIFELLNPYFKNIYFSDPVLFKLPEEQSIEKHFFMDHYMSYLCVL
ncbi:MAG: DUF3822 family protein [Saprospiraceae bacterium]|nr:DUF3822 family protein [Saprospiraceae bacterium]